jgi:hypothetical protein
VGELVQARGRFGDGEVGPQPVDEQFPMQPAPWGEREQLHQRGRLWPRPADRRYGRPVEQSGWCARIWLAAPSCSSGLSAVGHRFAAAWTSPAAPARLMPELFAMSFLANVGMDRALVL